MPVQLVERTDRFVHVALTGRLDITEVQAIEVKFLGFTASSGKPAIVDLTEVTFIGSMGLGMLAGAARSLHGHGASLVLANPQELVELVLRTASLQGIMPIVRTLDEAKTLLGLT